MKICIFSSDPIGDAFTRNHLIISMHQSVGLEVQTTPRAFPGGEIVDGIYLLQVDINNAYRRF